MSINNSINADRSVIRDKIEDEILVPGSNSLYPQTVVSSGTGQGDKIS